MNKLFDERRYDDVLRVFNRLVKTLSTKVTEPGEKEFFPYDALKVAIEANLEKVNPISLKFNFLNYFQILLKFFLTII